jgi:hypothetical protein
MPPYSFLPTGARERAILFSGPWYRSQVEYEPRRFLLRITVPVLIVGGGLDPVLPPDRHHPPIVAAIGSLDVHAEVVPDVNHLLLPATTGSPAEYTTIRDPADPQVLSVITQWLTARGLAWSRADTHSTRDAAYQKARSQPRAVRTASTTGSFFIRSAAPPVDRIL